VNLQICEFIRVLKERLASRFFGAMRGDLAERQFSCLFWAILIKPGAQATRHIWSLIEIRCRNDRGEGLSE
jgi:hypothetical protein